MTTAAGIHYIELPTSHLSEAYLSKNSTSLLFLSGGRDAVPLPVHGLPLESTMCS